jgi:hypothetical protein
MIPQLEAFSPTAECLRCKTFDTRTLYIYVEASQRRHRCNKCHFRFNTEMLDVEANEPTAEHIAAVRDASITLKHLPDNRYPTIDRRGTWERIGHPIRVSQIGELVAVYRCRKCGGSAILLRGQFYGAKQCECVIAASVEYYRRKRTERLQRQQPSIADRARANGVPPNVAYVRLRVLGWALERAVTQPVPKKRTTKPPKTSQRKTTIAEMARANGVPPRVAYLRLHQLKWDLQRAVTQPVREKKKNRERGDQCE